MAKFWKKPTMLMNALDKAALDAVNNHKCDYIPAVKKLNLTTAQISTVRDMVYEYAEEHNIKLRVAGGYKTGDFNQYD